MSENNHNSNGYSESARRFYSDRQIADALAVLQSCGGIISRASRETGIPRKTLENWARGNSKRVAAPELAQEMAEMRQQSVTSIADRLEALIGKILDVADGKLESAHFGQAMTGLAIATDKMRLLREQPTSITADATRISAAIEQFMKRTGRTEAEAREYLAPYIPEIEQLGKIG